MDVLAGTAVTLWADFVSSTDDLVVPDEGTVSFSLYNRAGGLITGPVELTPEAQATGVSISIPGTVNALISGDMFDQRTVALSWIADGRSGIALHRYRIIPLPLYTATANTVRGVIGIAADELPDADIDLWAAYLIALQRVGAALDAALMAPGYSNVVANRIVAYTAVEQLLPSLPQRMLKTKSDGSLQVERLKDLPLVGFAEAVAAQLLADIETLVPPADTTPGTPFMMLLTSPTTDPVTGNAPDTGA